MHAWARSESITTRKYIPRSCLTNENHAQKRSRGTDAAPWYVVPADDKDEAHVIGAMIINHELSRLGLKYPVVRGAALKEIDDTRDDLKRRFKRL